MIKLIYFFLLLNLNCQNNYSFITDENYNIFLIANIGVFIVLGFIYLYKNKETIKSIIQWFKICYLEIFKETFNNLFSFMPFKKNEKENTISLDEKKSKEKEININNFL